MKYNWKIISFDCPEKNNIFILINYYSEIEIMVLTFKDKGRFDFSENNLCILSTSLYIDKIE